MLQELLDVFGGLFGFWCFLRCVERLGKISWFDAKWASVTMYLTGTLWSIWIVRDALTADLEWYQACSLIFVGCFIGITRHRWLHGVPREIQTKPGELTPLVERRVGPDRRKWLS